LSPLARWPVEPVVIRVQSSKHCLRQLRVKGLKQGLISKILLKNQDWQIQTEGLSLSALRFELFFSPLAFDL
jgi:hypothetical protein